jgi:RIP metalloprotease RseP
MRIVSVAAWFYGPGAWRTRFFAVRLSRTMAIVFGILGLGLLMVVHELGHYLAARAFKMRVTRFSIGFGPALFRHTPKGSPTTYQIAIIPLLAYVQIAGMNPLEEVDTNDQGSYANASLIGRIATIFAGPLANYLFASVLFFITIMIGGQPVPTTKVTVQPNSAAEGPAEGPIPRSRRRCTRWALS